MSLKVAYGCCVGSWDRFQRYVAPRSEEGPLLGLSGQTSIADAYNLILDAHQEQGADLVVLMHDDLEITDLGFEEKITELLRSQPDVGLIGVAGGSARGGLAWWNHDPVGHQMTDGIGMIDFGQREGNVDLLEGSLLVFTRWAIRELRFEPRAGFHGYDEIAMQSAKKGMRVIVADLDTHHHTALGFDNEQSHDDWLAADRWFRQKWGI